MAGQARYGTLTTWIYRLGIDPLLRPLRRRVVAVCRDLGARNVLDIASATGAQCIALDRAGIRATGVDLSAVMVRMARRRSPGTVRYVEASALDLPFESGAFDVALFLLALHEHPEAMRRAMLREAQRVLTPDGVLILAEYAQPQRMFLNASWWVIRAIERLAGGEHATNFRAFMRAGGVRGLEHRAGLVVEQRQRLNSGAIELVVCRFHRGATLLYGERPSEECSS